MAKDQIVNGNPAHLKMPTIEKVQQEVRDHNAATGQGAGVEISDSALAGTVEVLSAQVTDLQAVLRRILAEPELLAIGDKHFCNELREMIDR
jgi:hypothetical protein